LKRANNNNSIKLFDIFVKEFASKKNAKKREISNSIITNIKNFDNIIEKNNNKQETRYKTQDNAKELNYNYYIAINNNYNNKKSNKSEKNKSNNNKSNNNNNKINIDSNQIVQDNNKINKIIEILN